MNAAERRSYRMRERAQSAAATGERILDATVALFWERPGDAITLEAVARRAGVTVQTVIRRFGGRDGLVTAAVERETARVGATRDPAAVDSVAGAVTQLVAHYEEMGDRVIRLLAEEVRLPALRPVAEIGRDAHRRWCEEVFASALDGRSAAVRRRRLAQLVAICDVYTWKLLRRDSRLTRRQTELALVELIAPLMEGS
jgi:AcrR family transcriptional regulator